MANFMLYIFDHTFIKDNEYSVVAAQQIVDLGT